MKGLCKEGMYEKVSFSLRKGELLGVAGLMGSFREEIVKTLYGLIQADSGEILLHGRKINPKNPEDAIRNGIGFVTEDRKTAGIFGLMSVRENLTINVLKRLRRVFWIPADREQELLDTYQKI